MLSASAVHVVQETVERSQVANQLAKQQRKAILLQQVCAVLTCARVALHVSMVYFLIPTLLHQPCEPIPDYVRVS